MSDPISYQSNAIRAQPQAAEGFVTLSLSVLLLSILALTSLYAAQFKLQEQRILANHQRVQLAGLIARAALTKAAFQLIIRRDPEQLPATGILTGGRYEITWQQSGPVVQLTATGFAPGGGENGGYSGEHSGEHSGENSDKYSAVSQQASVQVVLTSLLKQQPEQPVLVRDGITTNGTAVLEQWPEDGLPYERVVSTDLLSDLFIKPPGVKSTDTPAGRLRELKALAELQTTNCRDISTATVGFVWVNGDCQLAPRQELGQPDHPIILVVEDGQLELGYQAKIYGLIVSLAQQPGVLVSDSGTIYGALWANHGLQLLGSKLTVTLPYSIQYWLMQHLALKRSLIIPEVGTMARFNERGVSLIEVMVALVILSTGILALAAMQRQFIQASVRIQTRGDALALAESQLAVLLAMPTVELSSDSGNLTVPGTATSWHLDWTVHTLETASAQTSQAAPIQGSQVQARVVQLTVSWTPLQGAAETLTVAGWRLLIGDREAT